jgi:hypothetical protein
LRVSRLIKTNHDSLEEKVSNKTPAWCSTRRNMMRKEKVFILLLNNENVEESFVKQLFFA